MFNIGFDYSLSSPAMCISKGDEHVISVLNGVKKYHGVYKQNGITICIGPLPEWSSPQQRYEGIAQEFISVIDSLPAMHPKRFFLEDYSMGSKGKVFHIAENTEVLKYLIFKIYNQEFETIAPTSLKKFATGKGNAKKGLMADAFQEKTGFLPHLIIGCKVDDSPASDIVDSFFVAKYK